MADARVTPSPNEPKPGVTTGNAELAESIADKHQPDPMLRMSAGHVAAGGITLAALVIAAIIGVVFYGLNNGRGRQQTAAVPPAPSAPSAQPTAGGAGGAAAPSAPRPNQSGVKG
jgi:hypothetical protein